MAAKRPLVGILMGSESDLQLMEQSAIVLEEMGVRYEMSISSAHRLPDETLEYARSARKRGVEVIIAGAGMAAHLAGALAANTTLPVIGVPIAHAALSGADALYSTVQMPPGIPVATVAINGARNAAYLACSILSIKYPAVARALENYRSETKKKLIRKNIELQKSKMVAGTATGNSALPYRCRRTLKNL